MPDINVCGQKYILIFSQSEILALTRVNTSAASCNEALYSQMIVTVGLLGPLPRSDNPLQATYTLERCQASVMLQKMYLEFCQIILKFSA